MKLTRNWSHMRRRRPLKRFPCAGCGSLVDPDLLPCPFCGEADPARLVRWKKKGFILALFAVMAFLASWVVLP
ncbi:MAG: hypothetical protein ACE5GJ_06640 [Gemmatimonadota bacterium]